MIAVEFNPNKLELTVTGHAGFAEKGKDIVCAGASILFYTLAQSLLLSEEGTKYKNLTIEGEEEEEEKRILCEPQEEQLAMVKHLFWQTLVGYELLSMEYPEHVKLKIIK